MGPARRVAAPRTVGAVRASPAPIMTHPVSAVGAVRAKTTRSAPVTAVSPLACMIRALLYRARARSPRSRTVATAMVKAV